MRRSVKPFNASKIEVSPPDSAENSSIAFPLKTSAPFARMALKNFACHSLDSFIGTLTDVFVATDDPTTPLAQCLLEPFIEELDWFLRGI